MALCAAAGAVTTARAADEARGRYQLFFNPQPGQPETYLLDTLSGRVWQMVYNEREAEPWFVERAVQKEDNPRFAEVRRESMRRVLRERILESEFHRKVKDSLEAYAGKRGWSLDWADGPYPVSPAFRTAEGEPVPAKEYEADVRADMERLAKEHPSLHAEWMNLNREFRQSAARSLTEALKEPPKAETR